MSGAAGAPEYILGDAFVEYILAHRSVRQMKEVGFDNWTRIHGFFGNMGGFTVAMTSGDTRALTTAELLWLVERGYLEPFKTSRKEIEDRSKADPLLKFLACLQVCWFLLQCLVRACQGLTVTALEVTTTGFVVCAIFVYSFWMEKPLDVGTPNLIRGQSITPFTVQMMEQDVKPAREITDWVSNSYLAGREIPALGGLVGWSYDLCATCVFGCVLGAVHLAAWNLSFPTDAEQILWRTASIGTAAIPLLLPAGAVALHLLRLCDWFRISEKVGSTCTWILVALYGTGRAYLLVASFTSLRQLPLDAYTCIDWTNVIPHL